MIWYVGLFWLFLCLLVPAAFRWGEWPERAAALLYLAAALCSVTARPILTVKFHYLSISLLVIDVGLLCGLLIVAAKADRWWPMVAVALQALATLAHIAKMINPRIYALGYQLMEESSAYPTLVILGIGIWRQHRRAVRSRTAYS